jgi:hypothetical protein
LALQAAGPDDEPAANLAGRALREAPGFFFAETQSFSDDELYLRLAVRASGMARKRNGFTYRRFSIAFCIWPNGADSVWHIFLASSLVGLAS